MSTGVPFLPSKKSAFGVPRKRKRQRVEDSSNANACDIFLGGACNPTTWRKDIAMGFLSSEGVSFYNPQVDNWTPDLVEVEAKAKKNARILFFVVGPETRGIASMVEVAELVVTRNARVVPVIIDVPSDGSTGDFSSSEIKDLNRGRCYLRNECKRFGVTCFDDIQTALAHAVKMIKAPTGVAASSLAEECK